jgi:hypothetical protein
MPDRVETLSRIGNQSEDNSFLARDTAVEIDMTL